MRIADRQLLSGLDERLRAIESREPVGWTQKQLDDLLSSFQSIVGLVKHMDAEIEKLKGEQSDA